MCASRVTRHTSIWYSSSCHRRVNMGASIFFTAVMICAFMHGLVCRQVLCILCTKCMLHSNHRLTHDIPTHKTTSPSEWPFSYYIHSYHLVAEMWTTMKNNLLGKKFLSCSFCLYRFRKYVSYSFPTINFCNPRVHYEMPCIVYVLSDRLYLDGNIHYWQVSYDSYFLWKSLHVMKPGFRGTVLKEYCQMSGWNVS